MKYNRLKHHIHIHNLILLAVLVGAVAFWGFGVSVYGRAKTTLRDAKEVYVALDNKLSEATSTLNEVKTYCATQTLNTTLPELPVSIE